MASSTYLPFSRQALLILWTIAAFGCRQLLSQNVYISGNGPAGDYILGQFNIETCQFCPEFIIPYNQFSNGMTDVVPLPNGEIVVIGTTDLIRRYNPPGNTPLATVNPPGTVYFSGGALAPNGNVLITGYEVIGGNTFPRIYEYNPVTNSVTIVGELPAPINWFFAEIFFWNGLLYAFMTDASNQPATYHLVTIQLGNPMVVDIVYTYPDPICGAPVASIQSGPYAGIYGGALDPDCTGTDVYDFDLASNTADFVCQTPPSGYPYGMGTVPPGFPPATECLCFTDAGSVPTPNQTLCADEVLTFTNTGGFLEGNDIKQYVLFTNPSDTAGSIVATSSTPSFTFGAPLQTGVTYYFAAMAGNNLNGNVDLNDPCLDFSNARTVVWRPLPEVSLATDNNEVCADDCRNITATLTGTPPFTLTVTSPAGTTTLTFQNNTGTFQICPPPGTPPGSFVVQATALVDAFCTCD